MRDDTRRDINTAALASSSVGAGLASIALARKDYQDKVDLNKVLVRGGTYSPEGAPKASTVFNSQRDSWAKALREVGAEVDEKANYSMPGYVTGTYDLNTPTPKNPVAELHVGAHPKKNVLGILMDRVLGKVNYRVFSDFGPGNQNTGRYYLGSKNWMRAPKGPWYDRNVVPGGDLVKTPNARRENINVTSIPVNDVFSSTPSVHPPSTRKQIFLSAGTGFVWPKTLEKPGKDLQTLVGALDKHYGTEYDLHILGGPNAGKEYQDVFNNAAAANKNVHYINSTDQAGVKQLFSKADVAIMAPGSITAELASVDGYKPKVIGLGLKGEPHFKTNVEWYDKAVGGGEFLDLSEGLKEDHILSSLRNLESKTTTEKSIKNGADDALKILETARKDYKNKIKVTKVLGGVGVGMVGAAALAGVVNNLFEKKAKLNTDDSNTMIIGGVAGAGVAARSLESSIRDVKTRKFDFADFDEVKNYYKDAQPGDVIFLKDGFSRGNGHPVVVVDAQGHYDWPDAEGWEKGLRPKKVEDFSVIDPERPYRAQGKIMEMYPGSTGVRVESLEGKLNEITHINEPYIDDKGNEGLRRRFDRKNARQLGGLYRHPDLDAEKFIKNVEIVADNVDGKEYKYHQVYKYNPVSSSFKIGPGVCASGNCNTFANGLLEHSKNNTAEIRKAVLPSQLLKNLKVIKEPKTPPTGSINYISTLLALDGGRRFIKGVKENDAAGTATGAAEMGAGIATNLSKSTNSFINTVGGFSAQTLGGFTLKAPFSIKDGIKGIKVNEPGSSVTKLNDYLKRNPRVGKAVGATMLTVPVVYGIKSIADTAEEGLRGRNS